MRKESGEKPEWLVNVLSKPFKIYLHSQEKFKLRSEYYFLVNLFWKTSIPVMICNVFP